MSPATTPHNSSVLIADDDPSILRLIMTIVEGEGLTPVVAVDGKDAYRLLKSNDGIAGAIIDVRMPYIKGTDLVRFMRSEVRFRDIPVIVMTGDVDPGRSAASLAAGAVAFLPKPFSNAQLRAMLRTFIKRNKSK